MKRNERRDTQVGKAGSIPDSSVPKTRSVYSPIVKHSCLQDYLVASMSMHEIAVKHSVVLGTLLKWSAEDHWPDLKRKLEAEGMQHVMSECLSLIKENRRLVLKRHLEATAITEDAISLAADRLRGRIRSLPPGIAPYYTDVRAIHDLARALDASGRVSSRAVGMENRGGAAGGFAGTDNPLVMINLAPSARGRAAVPKTIQAEEDPF